MNRDKLNQLEEISFRITMVIVFLAFIVWFIGMIVRLLSFVLS